MASATTNNSSSSSSSALSPRHMSENHGNPAVSAAQTRRPSRQVSSPWTQIVRGESEPIAAAPSSPQPKAPIEQIASVSAAPSASLLTAEAGAVRDEKSEESGGGQGNAGKKPVWKRPSNGASEVGPVMGASSWPALSETTKAPSNKSSSDSLKSLGDVPSSSVPISQVTANASVPAQKQVSRSNPNPTPTHSRQRSFKRNGPSGSANGSGSQPSAQGSFIELNSHNPSPRGQNQRNGFASQSHGGTDNVSQRDAYRNQNGNHHQSHGGRRGQEHGNQNWNSHRNFNGRDGHAQSQRGTPAFVRHAPPPVQPIPAHAQYMPAQPMQPFGSPVPFPELASPYYPRMPFIAPLGPAPVFYHVQDLPFLTKIQNQIHYYFSEENLIRDTYLRGFMDDQGFVPLHLIATFKKVAELTDTIQPILEALQGSPVVEVQGDRIRRRHNWQKYLLPKVQTPTASSPQSIGRGNNTLSSQVRNLTLNQNTANPIGGSSTQLQPAAPETVAIPDGQQQSSGAPPVNNNRTESDRGVEAQR